MYGSTCVPSFDINEKALLKLNGEIENEPNVIDKSLGIPFIP
ncbi:MAG: hypothetical protein ACNI22_04975 [Halarcobacter sp.]